MPRNQDSTIEYLPIRQYQTMWKVPFRRIEHITGRHYIFDIPVIKVIFTEQPTHVAILVLGNFPAGACRKQFGCPTD